MDKTIDGSVSNTFGRHPYFIISENKNKKIKKTEVVEKSTDKMSDDGISAAKLMEEEMPML